MDTVEDIKAAILGLSPTDRARMAEWLDRFALEVREPAVPYGAQPQPTLLSVEEYLQLEERSPVRHEYIHGVLYAMSDTSERHNLISGNLLAAIHGHLRGKPCRVYRADFKVRLEIDHGDIFYYPDVMVACRREGVETHYLRYPTLIGEVLSPSTAAIDRREKLLNYTQIPTLEEYALVSQKDYEITLFRRAERWAPCQLTGPGAALELRSIEMTIPFTEIYDQVF
jgi:Uma2 family endonuclease